MVVSKFACRVIFFGIILAFYPGRSCVWAEEPAVRVAILQDVPGVRVTVMGPCCLKDLKSQAVLAKWPALLWQEVRVGRSGVVIGRKEFPSAAVVLEAGPAGVVRVNAAAYRNSLLLYRSSPEKVTVVNRLPLEEYLVGALASEVSPDWPMEALKTQAVVSRTMVAHRIWIRKKQPFDVTADVSTHR